ncbi:Alpha-amylase A type-1/2 [Paramyrothecium foliicola]|nr:Alpha-amylase A type-1/2 [Paramyrothecium foliicola]
MPIWESRGDTYCIHEMLWLRLLSAVLLQLSAVFAADTETWKTRNIYFALTDRIARDAGDSGGGACDNLGQYCGGTFKGLQSKLEYIRGMGFDAIWITPVVENHDGGYHGYHTKNLYAINPNYGTANDLKDLISAAHDMGMFVMVDVVANHMGPGPIGDNSPAPLNQQISFHQPCEIDYSNQQSVERCQLSGLPDLNTENPAIRTLFQTWIRWLVTEFKIDGLRVDTVKHVEKSFWPEFAWASGVYTIGEVYSGDPEYLAGYQGTMAGLLNFATYYPLARFLQEKQSPQDLVNNHDQLSALFADPTTLGTFLDNHDNPRWLNQNNDISLLKNALAYVILARGIPIVYYGTEQGYGGGNDPANREDLWRSGFNTNSDLYRSISRLSAVRSGAGGLGGNDHAHLYIADNAYAFSRAGGNIIVLITNHGSGFNGQQCFGAGVAKKTWENTFGTGAYDSDDSGNLCVQVTNGEPVVLVARS